MPLDPEFDAKMALPTNLFRAQTGANIFKGAVGVAGLAAAVRGAKGLLETWQGSHSPPPTVPTRRQFVTVPVPRRKEAVFLTFGLGNAALQAAKAPKGQRLRQVPRGFLTGVGTGVGGLAGTLGGGVAGAALGHFGSQAMGASPETGAGAIIGGAVGGGLYGGYKGLQLGNRWTDRLLERTGFPYREPDEKDEAEAPAEKAASGPFAAAAAAMLAVKRAAGPMDPVTEASGRVLDSVGGLKAPDSSNWGLGKETFWNSSATSWKQMPWAIWAGGAMLPAAGYAGWKGTDALLRAGRRNETDSELAESKKQYERALMPKAAGEEPDAIDLLYDRIKEANWLGPLAGAPGGYALAATGLAVGAGVGAYNWERSHSEDKTVEDAMRQRRERMFAAGPSPIVAVPEEQDPEVPTPPHYSLAALRQRLQAALPKPKPKQASTAMAAHQALQRFDQQKQHLAQQTAAMLGIKPDGGKAGKPAAPAAPQLPSVVNPSPAA